MSFSHYHLLTVPRSTSIKEDMLLSYQLLDQMEGALSEYEKADQTTKSDVSKFAVIRYFPEKLEQIIKVYNENLTHINSEYVRFKRGFTTPTFEEFNNTNDHRRSFSYLYQEYRHEQAIAEHNHMKGLDEAHNLGQLGLFSSGLKQKIERVIQHSLVQNLPVQNLPALIPFVKLESHQLLVCECSLRRPRDEAVKAKPPTPQASTELPTSSSSSNSSMLPTTKQLSDSIALPSQQPKSTTSTVIQVPTTSSNSAPIEQKIEISLSSQQPESTTYVSATIPLPKINGTLAIFHNPNWVEDKPLPFTSTDEGWKGPIPLNRDFKFVIVNGNDIEWENSPNRNIKMEDSLPPIMGVPKFSSLPNSENSLFRVDWERWESQPAVEEAIPQPAVEAPLTVSLTIPYSLEEGQTLGICHEPNWIQEPILFTSTAQGWQGEVPYGKEFKYVIIMNREVVRWENGGNRSVKLDSTLPLGTDSPNF